MSSEKAKTEKPQPKTQEKSTDEQPLDESSESTWFKPIYLLIPLFVLPPIGLAVLTYASFYPDVNPEFYSPEITPELVGPLEPNSDLNKAQLTFENVTGAESIVFAKGFLYTGLLNGKIVRIKGETLETFLDCDEAQDDDCGRPLGLRVDADGKTLYVADSLKGVYKIDIDSKIVTTLCSAMNFIADQPFGLIDDLTVTKEGDIYFTDASSKYGFGRMHLDFVESAPNGRILHFDPRTNSTRLVLDQLYFPNGIQLDPDENSFIFSESSRHRILRYYLNGPNKNGVEVIADNLPGIPDNIRASGRGTYWVSLVIPRLRGHRSFNELLAPYPWLRQVVIRAPYLPTIPFQMYDYLFNADMATPFTDFVDALVLNVGGGLGGYGLVVEIDSNGNIIRSLHSQDGMVHSISQTTEYKGNLYMGSPWENGIWKLSLKKKEER